MKHECNNYRPTFTQKILIYISVGYSFYIITFAIVMAQLYIYVYICATEILHSVSYCLSARKRPIIYATLK